MTTMGPLNQASRKQDPATGSVPGFTMTRTTMAILIMWASAIGGGVGAGVQWGWGAGLLTSCIMMAVYGVLLGIGS